MRFSVKEIEEETPIKVVRPYPGFCAGSKEQERRARQIAAGKLRAADYYDDKLGEDVKFEIKYLDE